jgi:hypothetical protein
MQVPMRRRALSLLFAGALASLTVSPGCAVGVTFSPDPVSYADAFTRDGSATDYEFRPLASLPGSGAVQLASGASSAVTGYDLSASGFTLTFTHARGGALASNASGTVGVYFSVDAPVDYAVSGSYTAVDPSGGHVSLGVSFTDVTENAQLFHNAQESFHTPNEHFTVGEQGSDSPEFGDLIGSPTGTLLPGHQYSFIVGSVLQAPGAADGGATGSGTVRLVLVPEPSAHWLLLTGLLGVACWRRR